MKKIKRIVFLALVFSSVLTHAQNVDIPDANFKNYLLGNTAINTNGDAEISFSEATSFGGEIRCGYMDIVNLQGIEAFINLTILNCANNYSLTNLDVTKNTALTGLHCDYNQLTNLDVSKNTSLEDLFCSFNQLTN